jgi:DNA-binding MarR family transcriptional regulator
MSSDETGGGRGNLPEIDPVVHAPARLAIMGILHVAKRADFIFLMRQTGLTRGNLSTHLSKLEAAGYVAIEKKFVERMPRTLVHLTKVGRDALRKYREQMRKALDSLSE